ncbi:DNA adenine methylase [Burkholderia sp. Ac-20392]|uniref:DNA adenine methylase n=1 Tax=Burkholderia sp. Ac-20392 TaxID=2703905 RepID=UPI00197E7110|nr:DNA adenine methylase [Burkholderia sp. Ac-20392]MBN3794581.1 DNA adenine methylase [Burkholderia sp. Ac-20392]
MLSNRRLSRRRSRGRPNLIPRFPAHDCYVEVFAGGAALYFMRPPAKVEVVNDINGELINLYRVVQHHVDEFVRQFNWAFTSRELFGWLKHTIPEALTDIQRAARFYYLQKSCFGGKLEGQTFGSKTLAAPGLNPIRLKEELSVAHQRLANAFIERLDWAACIDRYDRPHTLFYLDPPYYETQGYGVPFPFAEYEKMAERLRRLKGRAIVSLNDHPDIRRVFEGFYIETVPIQYTVGVEAVDRNELIIFSWDDAAQPVGLF